MSVFIELAGDGIGLVIFEIEAVQQRDQPRAAFVNEAEFLRDKGADRARRARQRGADKGFGCRRTPSGSVLRSHGALARIYYPKSSLRG
jgi:hypothetical protein